MFSKRSDHDPRKNRISLALAAQPPELDLTESNPTRTELPYQPQQLLAAFDNPALQRYEPDPHGALCAREAVARQLSRGALSVSAEQITLASGTSEAYAYLFKLLCDPGDEVLVPEPSYPLFSDLSRLEHVRTRSYPLHYDGEWHIGLGELAASITQSTRAILIVNPNNPTGSYLKRDELRELERYGLPLISDEVFSEYVLRDDPNRISTARQSAGACVFTLGGLSKLVGLPQWKLAWIYAHGPADWLEQARERLALIADTYLSVATPTQHALPKLLELGAEVREAIHVRLRRNLAALTRAVAGEPAVSLLDVEGGFYATLRLPRIQSEEEWVLELLQQDSVYVQPGFFFDFREEAYVVLSLLTPEAQFDAGVARMLQRIAAKLSGRRG